MPNRSAQQVNHSNSPLEASLSENTACDGSAFKDKIEVLKISKLVHGGYGLAKSPVNNKTVFVSGSLEGETVKAKIKYYRKGVLRADTLEVLENPHESRRAAICSHAKNCGGCSFQHYFYEAQLVTKQKVFEEIYQNLPGLPPEALTALIKPPVASPKEFYYRNKCEFSFGEGSDGKITLGLHPPGEFGSAGVLSAAAEDVECSSGSQKTCTGTCFD
jgi:tRNA/tmRNA/rRNA uracil-C5-methylase (TrmA/RlmC/RlmD family)